MASVSQYRTMSFTWLNMEKRMQWAIQGYNMTQFYYGELEGLFYDPAIQFIDRDFATATRTIQGGTAFAIYPFNRYRRIELFGGISRYQEQFNDPLLEQFSAQYQQDNFGRSLFNNGTLMPVGAAFVQETTIFREFGPLSGSTMRLSYEVAPKIGNSLSRQTVDADARKYFRLGATGLLALRARGFKSWGNDPDYTFFGGNSELRGYEYLEFLGQNAFFTNAELRFPLIDAMATPIGVLGGVRATLFAGLGGSYFDEYVNPLTQQPFKAITSGTQVVRPIVDFDEVTGAAQFGGPVAVSGLRLVDSRASYGISLATFALGFPVHFDWSWKTLLNKQWEDVVFAQQGGSQAFRKPKFTMWIGYDW
jgi:outer membrane protein assembly factor BamA